MAGPLYTANYIAVLWDFDQTLIPGYQQEPLFAEYGINGPDFWKEATGLVDYYGQRGLQVGGSIYLNHMLAHVRTGRFPGLTNSKLREFGSRLTYYEGIPEFFEVARKHIEENDEFKKHGITVEHYIISTGLRQIILGSSVAPFVRDVWACEFIETPADPGFAKASPGETPPEREISEVGYYLDDTTKTRAVWEINKGVNIEPGKIGVNDQVAPEDRRVPLRNMLYVADGPSDIPILSILNQYEGQTLGVYNPNDVRHFKAVKRLRDQERVQEVVSADYREGTTAYLWILATLQEIAQRIVRDRDVALGERIRHPSGHVV
ncbi:MAG: haloacid dehalogenase-like hydrolase [Actinomycetota bacterium]